MGKVKKQYTDEEKRAFLVNLDMKVMKALAGNDEKQRKKFLRNLREWMDQRSQKMPLTDEDIKRIWKSLYYTMWMSDKPLVQEQCAEGIANLVHFSTWKKSLRFFKYGLVVLSMEWFGIDQLRLDKFLMFVRRLLRQALTVIQKYKWQMDIIQEFNNILLESVIKIDNSKHLGLTLHISEIFLEELAKVSLGKIKPKVVHEFLKPFIKYISVTTDDRQIKHTCKCIFHHLLNQTDAGIDYEQKFEAWKQQGFPGGKIDYMTKVAKDLSNDDDEGEEVMEELEVLDPRAGSVNVDLPQLKFNPLQVVNLLKEIKFTPGTNTKTRKAISKLITQFEKLNKGHFPLGIKEIPGIEDDGYNMKLKQSVNRLFKFEKQALRDSNKNRKRKRIEEKKNANEVDEELSETNNGFHEKLEEFIKNNDPIVTNGVRKDKSRIMKKKVLRSKKVRPFALTGVWTVEEFLDESILNSSQEGTTSLDVTATLPSPKPLISQNIVASSPLVNSSEQSLIGSVKNSPASKKSSLKTENVVLNGFSKNEALDEWNTSAQPGEYEYFIPSPKYKEKTKKMVQKLGASPSAFLNNSIQKLAKGRLSLDSNLMKNPFSKKASSPEKRRRLSMSVKKVKINLGLNQSQEMYEHDQQVRKSPAIPFDANKKPSKPLLKPYTFTGPMNPFYKFKSKLL